ncbi:MAG: transglutaminase-like domain-containing protein, partial [Oscillospiraceae bacterium]|nr:transglutaminase-like domain-containing protein [Oscillospiraceae bacterium]
MNKNKKKPPEYVPVYVQSERDVTPAGVTATAAFRIFVKVLLTWLAAGGLSVTMAQMYRIPVSLFSVLLVSLGTAAFLNVGLLYFRKRAIICVAAPFVLVASFLLEEVIGAVVLFHDHLMLVLDSRLLSTAQRATHMPFELTEWENVAKISMVFLVLTVFVTMLFTFEVRSRFVGFMLVATVFALTPAFAAEIAGFVSGIAPLAAGLIGNYAAWAAHAWENIGGLHQISYNKNKAANGEPLPLPEPVESDIQDALTTPKKSAFLLTPGKLPHFYKYSRNSFTAAVLSVAAVFMATSAVPNAVKFDYMAVVDFVRNIDVPRSVRSFFKHTFGEIDDGGYFGAEDISMGITMDNPPNGTIPVIRATLEDDFDKIYLRGRIGIDLQENNVWSTGQDSSAFRRLEEMFNDGFTSELEYQAFDKARQFYSSDGVRDRITPNPAIARQNVTVEYLARSGFALVPTQPRDPKALRADKKYDWYLDTVIVPKRRAPTDTFDTMYVRPDYFAVNYDYLQNFTWNLDDLYDWVNDRINDDDDFTDGGFDFTGDEFDSIYNRRFADTEWDFPCGTSSAEWNRDIVEYRELVKQVYTNVPEREAENIDKLLMLIQGESYFFTETRWRDTDDNYTKLFRAQEIHNYLRANYKWSNSVNNKLDGNTVLGNFLFETKRGHCALYAASMTLACRQIGIPARYVTGVVTVTDGGLTQEFAERDFHAWVEVYLDGAGWIPFDPTGGARGNDGGIVDPDGDLPPEPATTPLPTPPPFTEDTD